MIRTAEFYGLKKVYVYDSFKLLKTPESKKERANMAHMARVWTAGAIEHIEIEIVEDDLQWLADWQGRKIATLVDPSAQVLREFSFHDGDLLIFGNERDGLPKELADGLDHALYIPQKGITDCINVAVSFGIFLERALG
ncbi:MAG: TrmH family RNA methyltransferase [Bacteroidia bacterium]|nr:TrmH family RNA methyltransferase [Bacteroidia bacterium]